MTRARDGSGTAMPQRILSGENCPWCLLMVSHLIGLRDLQYHMAAGGVSPLRMTFTKYHISNLSSSRIVLVESLRAIMSHHAHEPFTIAFVLRTQKGA